MLQIRRDQMAVLSTYRKDRLVNAMEAHLRIQYPEETGVMEPDRLRSLIENGIVRAAWYGIEKEFDVERYLDIMFYLGLDFDAPEKNSWARAMLEDDTQTPAERLSQIYERIIFGEG